MRERAELSRRISVADQAGALRQSGANGSRGVMCNALTCPVKVEDNDDEIERLKREIASMREKVAASEAALDVSDSCEARELRQ